MRVLVEGDTNIYTGEIKRISPSISTGNRILIVEAEVRNNGQLRPGTFARAEIVTSNLDKALTIPVSALVSFAGIDKVILVQEGKAVEKAVTTGRRKDDKVEILTGLTEGDKVVLDPGNLQSGQSVNVVE
jgi:RND family efflux transporter MFP subunit